jgi:DNA-binding MarR family transcriptional regulator
LSSKAKAPSDVIQRLPWAIQHFVNTTALFQAAVAESLDLNVIDLFALQVLRSGAAETPSDLAREVGVTTGAATKILDRLQSGGFVVRKHDPNDRRKILLSLAPTAIGRIEELYQPMAHSLHSLIEGASEEQLRFLLKFAEGSSTAAAGEAAKLKTVRDKTRAR